MRDTKVRPIMVGSPYHHLDHFDEIQSEGNGISHLGSLEYRLARREFLKSYSFSSSMAVARRDCAGDNNGWWLKGKLTKSVRDAAVGALMDAHRGISRRRLSVRVFRVKVSLFASTDRMFVVTVRCFLPCINKIKI